jgi:hypothetical protein
MEWWNASSYCFSSCDAWYEFVYFVFVSLSQKNGKLFSHNFRKFYQLCCFAPELTILQGKHHISKVGLAFTIILSLLSLAALAFGIKKYIDRERILWLAETWDDEEFNE